MNIYAESSAVLAWLVGEEAGYRVREVLRRAALVTASDLALLECDRVLIRAVTLGEIGFGPATVKSCWAPVATSLSRAGKCTPCGTRAPCRLV